MSNNCDPCVSTTSNCCTEIIDTKCIKHSTGVLANIPVAIGDTLSTILKSIDTKFLGLSTVYDMQCLGGAANTSLSASITLLRDAACSTSTTLFNTTCLGGSNNRTVYQAVADMITVVCAGTSYPVFDTTCLNGSAVTTFEDTITALIAEVCAINWTVGTATLALDWTCLTAPLDSTIPKALQAIIDGVVANQLSFTSYFTDTPDTCGREIDLDIDAIAQGIYDTTLADTNLLGSFNANVRYKVSPQDYCLKNDLGDALAVTSPLTLTEITTIQSTFTYSFNVNFLQGYFNGIVSGNGVLESPISPISFTDTAGITNFLTSKGYTSVVVLSPNPFPGTITTVNVTLTTNGNSTDFNPVICYDYSTSLIDQTEAYTGYAAVSPTSECKVLRFGIDDSGYATMGGPTGFPSSTLNSGLNTTAAVPTANYYKDDFERVYFMNTPIVNISGVTIPLGTLLFTLASGYRPRNSGWFVGPYYYIVPKLNTGLIYMPPFDYSVIRIEGNGEVYLHGGNDLLANDSVDLRGISFSAE
jgi:hypothetical protein